MPTDYHKNIRDAVKTAIDALALGVTSYAVDEPDDITRLELPAIAVCCVGPEQDRPDFGTNERDGIGYPVAVMLLETGTSHGEKTTGVPELTSFRRSIRNTFNNKRLSGVSEVGYCEVSDSGPLVDERSPAFQKLATALVVNAVGRFPRS